MKDKYLTERERYQLEILLKDKKPVKEIAEMLGKCKATIYNEIKRGMTVQRKSDLTEHKVYLADVAQRKYMENRKNKGRDYKIINDDKFIDFVTEKVKLEKWSPCAVTGYIKSHDVDFPTAICKATLYSYIRKGLFSGLTVDNLPYAKKRWEKGDKRRSVALKNLKGRSIEERPEYINDRNEYGHWEMDTVYSGKKKSKECLLVFTERMTREELIFKIPDRTSESVRQCIDRMENDYGFKHFRNSFKTITCDNGVEFLNSDLLERSILNEKLKRTVIYYCHPFCSSERGSNENLNKMIRRHIPKGADISDYTDEFISYIQNWINNYPREIFGYLSTYEYMSKHNIG